MFRPEARSGASADFVPAKSEDVNQQLDSIFHAPVGDRYDQSTVAFAAEAQRIDDLGRKQVGDNILPEVQIKDGDAGKFSDAPPNAPVLDEQGRVQSINYADGTSRQFTYKDGHVDTYKDRDGHTWKFTPPNVWTQQDGTSVMHGEMIVDKDGSFTFINHDKNYVSHYGADGAENVSDQKKYSEYTQEELLALQTAGKEFADSGLPKDSVEKPKKDNTAPSEGEKPEPEPRPEPRPEPAPGDGEKPQPEPRPEPRPEPAPSDGEKEKPQPSPESAPVEGEKAEKPKPGMDDYALPLSREAVAAFARNFGLDQAEVARIGTLNLGQVRAEMQAMKYPDRPLSKKYHFYEEMVWRLTDTDSTRLYGANLT